MGINKFFILLFYVLSLNSYAQYNDYELVFNRLSVKDGLSHQGVTCILQDHEGFTWFGTQNGLNRFDGYNFLNYKPIPFNNKSLSHHMINSIIEDDEYNLWVGTSNGINKYNPATNSFENYDELKITFPISALTHDSSKNIWIGTRGGFLNMYNPIEKTLIHYNKDRGILDAHINTLLIDDNILWVGSEAGLNRINLKTREVSSFSKKNVFPENTSIKSISKDRQGFLWLGTQNGHLIKLDTKSLKVDYPFKQTKNPYPFGKKTITSLLQTGEDYLWVGTDGNGIFLLNKKDHSVIHYQNKHEFINSLSDNHVTSFYQIKPGILWIGTRFGGINKVYLNDDSFHHIQPTSIAPGKIDNNSVLSILSPRENILYIGTENNGLIQYNRVTRKLKSFSKSNSIIENNMIKALALQQGRDGEFLWIGTGNGGLYRMNLQNEQIQSYPYIETGENLNRVNIKTLLVDKNQLWIGGKEGLFLLNINDKSLTNISGELTSSFVNCLYLDKANNLWIGTTGGGLNKYNSLQNTTAHYIYKQDDTTGINSNDIYAIHEDESGKLLIGTGGGGLNLFDVEKGKFLHFNENYMVYNIIEDHVKNFWLSTEKGIYRYDPRSSLFDHYDLEDGLITNDYQRGSACINNAGEIFFGGRHGICSFSPGKINNHTYTPRVKITGLCINNENIPVGEWSGRIILNKTISYLDQVNLSYKDKVFSLEFAALDYLVPMKNKYAYILENYHEEWIECDAHSRSATFYNVPPGTYKFKVKGSNNEGKLDSKTAELLIIISPPFWNSREFILLVIVLIIALVSYLVYHYIKKIKKTNKKLVEQAKESLLDERNLLKTLINNSPDYIYIKDTNSKFIMANKRLAVLMGAKKPEELVGKTDHDFYDAILADKFRDDEQKIMKNKEHLIGIEEPGVDADGKPTYVSTSKIPIINMNDEVIGLIGISRDITELKLAHEKLRKQTEELQETNVLLEERQEEIFQQNEEIQAQAEELETTNTELAKLSVVASETDNAVMIIDRDGNVEWINDGFTRLYGYQFEHIADKDAIHYNFKPGLYEHVRESIGTKKTLSYETSVITRNSSKVWIHTMLTPISDANENIYRVVAIDTDITKMKTAETEIEIQRDELKTLNATKDKFFSIIAHDLKNPF
ncbi:MAG: two-component regulator propeller domain-containing protein, partial [bacterium]